MASLPSFEELQKQQKSKTAARIPPAVPAAPASPPPLDTLQVKEKVTMTSVAVTPIDVNKEQVTPGIPAITKTRRAPKAKPKAKKLDWFGKDRAMRDVLHGSSALSYRYARKAQTNPKMEGFQAAPIGGATLLIAKFQGYIRFTFTLCNTGGKKKGEQIKPDIFVYDDARDICQKRFADYNSWMCEMVFPQITEKDIFMKTISDTIDRHLYFKKYNKLPVNAVVNSVLAKVGTKVTDEMLFQLSKYITRHYNALAKVRPIETQVS